ncbi:uncharacterized protein L201_006514 [Kwoniella dendrophila CBS 6074]|uniref:4'-phosphopantetheinyl transferase domain-containing protein n=1 Tax=Kwoniella dendrophila CBS 6074 TaxID=1295534 RepID=A0AAX4K315_9TREE
MIAGIGIDILSLTRFRTLLLRRDPYKLAKRICTPNEYELFSELKTTTEAKSRVENGESGEIGLIDKQLRFLSSRWALKEATYKSLSSHLSRLTWQDLQITKNHKSGSLILTPTKEENRNKFDLLGSLSHDGGMVVGVVIAQFKT